MAIPVVEPGSAAGAATSALAGDSLPVPDVPDPEIVIAAAREQHATRTSPVAANAVQPTANRAPLWVGLGVALLIAAGTGWWFMRSQTPATGVVPGAPVPVAPATRVGAPAPLSAATPPLGASGDTSSTSTAASISPRSALPSASVPAIQPPPADVAPRTSSSPAVDADAQSVAADRKVRDRATREAREKAARDAKAKALGEQAERVKAQQEATRRAVEARTRSASSPPNPAPAGATPASELRTVREMCGGRGSIAQSICESNECGKPQHAGEAVCRQLREAFERRQNYTN